MPPTKLTCVLALAAFAGSAAPVATVQAQSSPLSAPVQAIAPRPRATFYQRMAAVRVGMTEAAARAAAGRPDFVLRAGHRALHPYANLAEVWIYGAATESDLPTHGSIVFDRTRHVASVSGTRAPRTSVVSMTNRSDQALRGHLNNIAAIGAIDASRFDPAPLVRAVNALQPIGRDQALDVIDEYLRVHCYALASVDESVFLLLRALFVPTPPQRAHPPALLGGPSPPPPSNSADVPEFPLAVVDDLPLVLVEGYVLGGVPQPAEQHMPWYRANATIRARPLAPRPATALATFAASPAGRHYAATSGFNAMLAAQVQRYNAAQPRRVP